MFTHRTQFHGLAFSLSLMCVWNGATNKRRIHMSSLEMMWSVTKIACYSLEIRGMDLAFVLGKNYRRPSSIWHCLSSSFGRLCGRLKTSQRRWEASRWQTDVPEQNRANADLLAFPPSNSGRQPPAPGCSFLPSGEGRAHPALGEGTGGPRRAHCVRARPQGLSSSSSNALAWEPGRTGN